MSSATIAAAAASLDSYRRWATDRAARHGTLGDRTLRSSSTLPSAWVSPRSETFVDELGSMASRHGAAASAMTEVASIVGTLAAEASEAAHRLASLEQQHDEATRELRRAREQSAAVPDIARSDALARVAALSAQLSTLSRQRLVAVERWDDACRSAASRVAAALGGLRAMDAADRRAAAATAAAFAFPYGAPPTSDLAWLESVAAALLASPGRDPALVVRELVDARADAALVEIRGLLGTERTGRVSRSDLPALQELFVALPAPVLDAVIRSMSDRELGAITLAAHGRRRASGWPTERRHELWTVIGSRVSLDTFRRFTRFTSDLDPPPATAIPDGARSDPDSQAWYDALVYAPFDGPLAHRGAGQPAAIDPSDITQGGVGNCYLIAALIATAGHDPGRIRDIITSNANGTYTVTFPDGMQVTVTPDFPTHPDAAVPAFANRALAPEHLDVPGTYELWPMVVEKAYAQRHGGWREISGGQAGRAVQELFGGTMTGLDPGRADVDELRAHLEAGRIVTFGTRPGGRAAEKLYQDEWLSGRHAYVITDVTDDGSIVAVNPWNPNSLVGVLTEEELRTIARRLQVNELP